MGRGLLPVPLCALLQHAGVGSREQVQPPLPLPRRRPFWGGGRPPSPGGAEGRACGSPAGPGAGGGGCRGRPPARSRACVGGGGGVGGGPLVPWRRPLTAGGGGGGMAVLAPGGQPSAGGSRPSPAPLYREPDPRAGPRWGPLSPGRCRAALAGRGWP